MQETIETQCPHQLKKDQNIKILPADKGNATVIMDKEDYENKINNLISTGNYNKLQKGPTTTVERKIYTTLKKYETSSQLASEVN